MSDEIKPALTPEDWHAYVFGRARRSGESLAWEAAYAADTEDVSHHGKAALYLHGQPFGFSRADVELLQLVSARLRPHPMADLEDEQRRLALLADRIEALLPPST